MFHINDSGSILLTLMLQFALEVYLSLFSEERQSSRFFILSYYIVKAAFLTLTGNDLGLGKKGGQTILSLSVHIKPCRLG